MTTPSFSAQPSSSQLITLPRPDGIELVAHSWPLANARAHVHIAHGMAEHGGRYAPLAAVLNAQGYSVTASDHRGHGQTALKNLQVPGHATDKDSWHIMVNDLVAWWQHCHTVFCGRGGEEGERPLFVFGHSLGSFMTLHAATITRQPLAGIVLSAIGLRARWINTLQGWVIPLLEQVPGLTQVDKGVAKSDLVQWLSFGAFNRAFKPNRTAFDWLTRDHAQVDAYMADPLCGQACSLPFWSSFLTGTAALLSPALLAKLPAGVPMLLLSGTRDPVGNFGSGVPVVAERLRRAGVTDVKVRMFHDARHELLNEINADEVNGVIVQWLAVVRPDSQQRLSDTARTPMQSAR